MYITNKRLNKENVEWLLNGRGHSATADNDKAEVLTALFFQASALIEREERKYQQWVRIKSEITYENSIHKSSWTRQAASKLKKSSKRTTQETKGCSALLQSLGKTWSKFFMNIFLGMQSRERR